MIVPSVCFETVSLPYLSPLYICLPPVAIFLPLLPKVRHDAADVGLVLRCGVYPDYMYMDSNTKLCPEVPGGATREGS